MFFTTRTLPSTCKFNCIFEHKRSSLTLTVYTIIHTYAQRRTEWKSFKFQLRTFTQTVFTLYNSRTGETAERWVLPGTGPPLLHPLPGERSPHHTVLMSRWSRGDGGWLCVGIATPRESGSRLCVHSLVRRTARCAHVCQSVNGFTCVMHCVTFLCMYNLSY